MNGKKYTMREYFEFIEHNKNLKNKFDLPSFVSVTDFGNIESNTLQCINKAIEYSSKNSVEYVYLPIGEYEIDHRIIMRKNVHLTGFSNKKSIVNQTNNQVTSVYYDIYDESPDINYTISNLCLKGTGYYDTSGYSNDPAENGIYLSSKVRNSLNNVVIKDVIIQDIDGAAILSIYANNTLFENCEVSNCNYTGYTSVSAICKIVNCNTNYTRTFIESVSSFHHDTLTYSEMKITNCSSNNLLGYGIKHAGGDCVIIDSVNISGNRNINLDQLHSEAYGVFLMSDSISYIIPVDSCVISNCNIDYMREGISIKQDSISADYGYLKIKESSINNTYYSGIRLSMYDENSNDSIVVKNVFMDSINNGGAYADGACIRLDNVNDVLITSNTAKTVQQSASRSAPLYITNSTDLIIEDNNFTNEYPVSIWVTPDSSSIYQLNNLGINGFQEF